MFWNRKKPEAETPKTFEEEVLFRLQTIETRTRKIAKTVNGINWFIWGIVWASIIGGVLNYFLNQMGF